MSALNTGDARIDPCHSWWCHTSDILVTIQTDYCCDTCGHLCAFSFGLWSHMRSHRWEQRQCHHRTPRNYQEQHASDLKIGILVAALSNVWQRVCARTGWPGVSILWQGGDSKFDLQLVLTPFPKNSFGWEYKLRSCLYTHTFHHTDSKDPVMHVLDRWMSATKTHPACTIHEDGIWLPLWLD